MPKQLLPQQARVGTSGAHVKGNNGKGVCLPGELGETIVSVARSFGPRETCARKSCRLLKGKAKWKREKWPHLPTYLLMLLEGCWSWKLRTLPSGGSATRTTRFRGAWAPEEYHRHWGVFPCAHMCLRWYQSCQSGRCPDSWTLCHSPFLKPPPSAQKQL